MSGSIKLGLIIIATVLAVGIVLKVVSTLMALVVPIVIFAALAFAVYLLVGRKALGPSRRRYLP